MRILFCTIKGGLSGGANIASKLLMEDLVRRGVIVHAIVSDSQFKNILENVGVECHKVRLTPFFQWPHWESWKRCLYSPIQLAINFLGTIYASLYTWRIVTKIDADFIETCNSPTLYGYFASRLSGKPHVWHLREYLGQNVPIRVIPSNSFLKNYYLKKSYTISITKDVADFFSCGIENKDFVVNDGVLHEDDVRYVDEKLNYFLFVGYVHSTKGCDDLIDAYISYCKQGGSAELWFAGECNETYRDFLLSKIPHKISDNNAVKFLGFRTDRFDLMSRAQATIVPSINEGFGFITVESIMNGSVVIGRNTGGTKMIMDEVKGGTIPFATVDELADAMKCVSENGVRSYKEQVLQSQEIARHKYSIEQCGSSVYSILQRLYH